MSLIGPVVPYGFSTTHKDTFPDITQDFLKVVKENKQNKNIPTWLNRRHAKALKCYETFEMKWGTLKPSDNQILLLFSDQLK